MSHINLRLTSDPTVEDLGIPHVNMVRDVVAGLQEALQQEQTQTETPASVQAPVDHVANKVQSTQQQLATQLQKIQSMMQTMQMHYNTVPHGTCQNYGVHQDYGRLRYHGNQPLYCG